MITEAERLLVAHVNLFGQAGYPFQRLGKRWSWGTDAVKGPPLVFKTKREAAASFEGWMEAYRRRLGEETYRLGGGT